MHKFARIIQLPIPEPIADGKLESIRHEMHGKRLNLVIDYLALIPNTVQLVERGNIHEQVEGMLAPRRLRFISVERLKAIGLYENVADIPPDHNARIIADMFNWRTRDEKLIFHLLFGRSTEDAELHFYARHSERKERTGGPIPVAYERDWSPAPPLPAGIIPRPANINTRFGGDRITFKINRRGHHRRLFIGGIDIQSDQRPDVDSVLNLGEDPSRWVKEGSAPATDRWINKGEGSQGMSVDEIRQEAGWVIERLLDNQRVLVHCVAGMNRSSTICCAVLILLEGLSAEKALERVREHHPWARPDGHHWLALRWLAQTSRGLYKK
jgi:hypothetical protein